MESGVRGERPVPGGGRGGETGIGAGIGGDEFRGLERRVMKREGEKMSRRERGREGERREMRNERTDWDW